MDSPLDTLGRMLVALGVLLVVIGALLWLGGRFSGFGLGKLPGDIVIRRDNFVFYFPVVTCLLLSIVLSLIFWLLTRLWNR